MRRVKCGIVLALAALLLLLSLSVGAAEAAKETVLINADTVWRYWDEGSDPVKSGDRLSWTAESFDDSAWKTSGDKRAAFGENKGTLDFGSYASPAVLLKSGGAAYFFRTTVSLSDVSNGYELTGTLQYADSAIVYINEKKVVAYHEPSGGFKSNMAYGGSSSSFPLTVSFKVDTSYLKKGSNTVAVEVHRCSETDDELYFELKDLTVTQRKIEQKTVSLTVGADENERNVTWHTNLSTPAEVQYAEAAGNSFPANYKTAKATSKRSANDAGFYINAATLTDLKPDTEYVYRLVNGLLVSDLYRFRTDKAGAFNFLFTGDPQIGSSSGALGWTNALTTIKGKFPNAHLLVTAGDQVNTADSEEQYGWYLQPHLMQSYTNAPVIGNHDATSEAFKEHFTLPNAGKNAGVTKAGNNYWFTYNDVLFIHLNTSAQNHAQHVEFVENALKENRSAKWKVVLMHHTIFSLEEGRWQSADTLARRNALAPAFDRLGIDVVLMGHDHTYVRTYMMDGLTPIVSGGEHAKTGNGVLYITGGSGSGSKYYDIDPAADTSFVAKQWQGYSASFSLVEVSDTAMTFTTYKTADMSVIDRFSLVKGGATPPTTVKTTSTSKQAATTTAAVAGNTTASAASTSVLSDGTTLAENTTTAIGAVGDTESTVTTVSTAASTAADGSETAGNGWIVCIVAAVVVCGGVAPLTAILIKKKKK